MNIGDYVRTKNGISKIKELHEVVTTDNEYITTLISTDNGTCGEENVIKYSQNIIDLIEVGDYVNGLKVTLINEPSMANCNKRLLYAEDEEGYLIKMFNEDDIKSIVTKEQFSQMEYKVGE